MLIARLVGIHVAQSNVGAATGRSPMQLVLDTMDVDDTLTAVHCTHSVPNEMAAYRSAGGRVNICPLTEANLGEGILGGWFPLSLGSDSDARISMLGEMRWLEYGQRLRRGERGSFRDEQGKVAPGLLRCATEEGADSLGIPAGRIEVGAHADFVEIDLNHPALDGVTDDTLHRRGRCMCKIKRVFEQPDVRLMKRTPS